jgi:hypothetical protein
MKKPWLKWFDYCKEPEVSKTEIKLPHNEDYEKIPYLNLDELECDSCKKKGMKLLTMGWASILGADVNDNEIGMRFRMRARCNNCKKENEWRFGIKGDKDRAIRADVRTEGYGIDYHFKRD